MELLQKQYHRLAPPFLVLHSEPQVVKGTSHQSLLQTLPFLPQYCMPLHISLESLVKMCQTQQRFRFELFQRVGLICFDNVYSSLHHLTFL